MSYSEIQVQNQ